MWGGRERTMDEEKTREKKKKREKSQLTKIDSLGIKKQVGKNTSLFNIR
jgi:tartrate dehydratase alpha subunit/fumarate hydratase class I-like protein